MPGETQGNVSLQIHDDMRIEDNETVQIYLIAGAGVNLTPLPRTEVTIMNDDGEFEILSLPVLLPLYVIILTTMEVCNWSIFNQQQLGCDVRSFIAG